MFKCGRCGDLYTVSPMFNTAGKLVTKLPLGRSVEPQKDKEENGKPYCIILCHITSCYRQGIVKASPRPGHM